MITRNDQMVGSWVLELTIANGESICRGALAACNVKNYMPEKLKAMMLQEAHQISRVCDEFNFDQSQQINMIRALFRCLNIEPDGENEQRPV